MKFERGDVVELVPPEDQTHENEVANWKGSIAIIERVNKYGATINFLSCAHPSYRTINPFGWSCTTNWFKLVTKVEDIGTASK